MATPLFVENQSEWDFYFCTIEDKPASIMLDLALIHTIPVAEKTEFIQVMIDLNFPNEHGLTNPAEAEILYIMEDHLAEHISATLGGIYAGRNTTGGQRIFYFYCNSSIDYRRIVDEAFEGFSTHAYTCKAQKDPDWSFYSQFLYPSPLEYQSILNRRVIDSLKKEGDDLSLPRDIEHYLYFPTRELREAFEEKAIAENFQVISRSYDPDDTENPFGLVIVREDKIDPQTMDEIVMLLVLKAAEEKGEYDGWGTGLAIAS
ncbi:MAG: DUF695 domain-containing protein [Bacteroidia bacterium]|nr:DUF695 domain-containing protein [Bacteroidia bacterium]